MREKKYLRMYQVRVCIWISLFITHLFLIQISPVSAGESMQSSVLVDFSQLDTTEVTSLKVSPEMFSKAIDLKGDPKLESSLNRIWEAHLQEGLAGAETFAESQNMVLKDDMVQVTIITSEDSITQIQEAVKAEGGENQLHYKNLLQTFVPIGALKTLAEWPDIQYVREPQRAIPMIGNQTTEGVAASSAVSWQGHNKPCNGKGVRVAVIDGGFTNYTNLLGTDLPSSVKTYDWTGGGMGGSPHGTACAEIIFDMAPRISMDLHKVGTMVEFGNAVNRAIADGVDIISASIGWTIDGPGDGTGFLSDIVKIARQNGIFYAAAAGNNAENCWSGTFTNFGDGSHRWAPGQNVNYFGPGNGNAYVIPAGARLSAGLHWDDWTVVDQDYDLYLLGWTGTQWVTVASSVSLQNGGTGQRPIEFISVVTPFTGPYGWFVSRYDSTRNVCFRLITSHTAPRLDKIVMARSLVFPADSPFAITVGAVDVSSFALESYSSRGPTFGNGGSCTGGTINPDIASYANVSTVSYGAGVFNGTSAAAPHVAGAAALVRQAYGNYTVAQLQQFLETRAIDLGAAGKDNLFGAGRLYLGPPADCVPSYIPAIPFLIFNEQ